MLALAPLSAAVVKMIPRIGPAHGAHNKPVATPRIAEEVTLSPPPGSEARSVMREPSATSGRVMRSEMVGKTSAMPNSASKMSAAQRPTWLACTAQPPPTAASVATIAKVIAIPASIGSVLLRKLPPARAKTNGSTGRMQGLTMVSTPPR